MNISKKQVVIIPTFNTGARLYEVVTEVLAIWQPVFVIVDGSTDGSEIGLLKLAETEPGLQVAVLERNSGKGAAVLHGTRLAQTQGFTHALVMDADGQHPAGSIEQFMAASRAAPDAMILGRPIFPANVPPERLHCRKISVGLVWLELFGSAVDDPLFGYRIYPIVPLLAALGARRGGKRYDFDTEAAVRMFWAAVPTINLAAPVLYFSRVEGGVSHFHYVRDNLTMAWMHSKLLTELLLFRWPALLRLRLRPPTRPVARRGSAPALPGANSH